CDFKGILFEFKKPVPTLLSHIHSYFSIFKLLAPSTLSKGVCAVRTIAPFSLMILLYSTHKFSNGIIESHSFRVVPYGKSHKIMSTLPSGIRFIPSKQSSLYILFNSTFTLLPVG